MKRARERLRPQGILVIGINVDEDEAVIFRFSADYPADFPLLMDSDSAVTGQWPVRGLPTAFVVDPAGRLVDRAIGSREWGDFALLALVYALR